MTAPTFTLAEAARVRRSADLATTWIYFIEDPSGPIKIGIARDPRERLATLQQGNPRRLTLRALWRGFPAEERDLHKQFAAARIAGEWFQPTPDLVAYVTAFAEFSRLIVEDFTC